MRACIHRGAHEVGGSLVELEHDGRRLVLDAGLPLDLGGTPARDLLPDVPGLWGPGDGSLAGVLVTHAHPDHHGLADLVDPGVPVLMGRAAAAIAREAAFFVPGAHDPGVTGYLEHGVPLRLGPFTVTPHLVDHSAFDAYALLVEAGGRRLLYTGDVRDHGRRGGTLGRLARAARGCDVVVLEGTRLGERAAGCATDADDAGSGSRRAASDARGVAGPSVARTRDTERDVEDALAALCRDTPGAVLAFLSPQNVDRVVEAFRAARRSGRTLVVDLYAASVLAATGRDTVPQAHWDGVRVVVPQAQRVRVRRARAFERVEAVRDARIFPAEMRDRAGELVVLCRGSMLGELHRAGAIDGAAAAWSMWPGYLRRPPGRRTAETLERAGVPLTVAHASGHATPEALASFVAALRPGRVVPIHTTDPRAYAALPAPVDPRADGEWWAA